jgi:alkanesulfonate monooxygenase SsuD/methylene tetrahydromethanopterin reductase-like flavin-dependent oxidoreductase (luciferase family)
VILGAAAIAHPDPDRAYALGRANALSMARLRTGTPGPLPSPEEALAHDWSAAEEHVARSMADKVSVGTPEQVAEDLLRKAKEADADELMITTAVHDADERRQSVRLVAAAIGAYGS